MVSGEPRWKFAWCEAAICLSDMMDNLSSLKLAVRTCKRMVGIRPFPFGARPIYRGELLGSGSVIDRN